MIKAFEGCRGLAAVLVALFHLRIGAEVFSPIGNGYVFVDCFFVLSGFVIYSSYGQKLHSADELLPFMIRRFGRLFPLLAFATAAFVLAPELVVFGKHLALRFGLEGQLRNPAALSYGSAPAMSEIIAAMTLTQGLGIFDRMTLNYVSWSISAEFYTYALFATLCFFFSGKVRLAAFAATSVLAILVTYWATLDVHECLRAGKCMDVTYDYGFARCIASFFLGALTCHVAKNVRLGIAKLQSAAAVLLTLLFMFFESAPAVGLAAPAVFAIFVISLSKDTGLLAAPFKTKFCQMLGRRSYSIYMTHPVLLILFGPMIQRPHGLSSQIGLSVGYIAVLVVISGWTYEFIEEPWRRIFNAIASRTGRARQVMPSATVAE